jgi:2-methylcitrate dehydratase
VEEVIASMVDFVDGLTFSDLSAGTVDAVRLRLVDSLGCMIGASASAPTKIARRVAERTTGLPSASVLGSSAPTSLEAAAFTNTIMVRYLDYNDSAPGGGHFSDTIPAVLAAAEATRASGEDLIAAIACAYEVVTQLSSVVRIRLRGWDPATYINVSIALTVGKLLGLTREKLANAAAMASISNISTWASREGTVSMWKACAPASASRHGIFTALLAAEGMTGPSAPFSGRSGVMELVTGKPFTLSFGHAAPIMAVQGSAIKLYPCQDDAQGPIEMALSLHGRVSPDEIAAIRIESFHIAYRTDGQRVHPDKWDPRTREMADHSLPYLVCVALVDGTVNLDSFAPERYLDPSLRPLMDRVTISMNEDFRARYPAELNTSSEIETTDGKCLRTAIKFPHGHPGNPPSIEEINRKYDDLTGRAAVSDDSAKALRGLAWNVETVPDVAVFGEAMRAYQPRAGVDY